MLKEDTNSSNNNVFFNIDVDSLDNTVIIPNDIYVKLNLECIIKIPEINKSINLELKLNANFRDKTNDINTKYKLLPLDFDTINTNKTNQILTNSIQDKTDNITDNNDLNLHNSIINHETTVHDIPIKNDNDLESYRNKLNNSIEFLEDYNRDEELKKISIVMNNLHEYISNFSEKMILNNPYDDTAYTVTEDKPKDNLSTYLNDITDETINGLDYNIIKQLIYHYTLLNNENIDTEDSIINNLIELMKFVTNFNIENILKKEYVITALKIIYKDTDKYKFIKIIEDQLIDTIIKLDKNKVKIKGHNNDDCNII